MITLFTLENNAEECKLPSIYLAGPTPRLPEQAHIASWRREACDTLHDLGFNGIVYLPEWYNGTKPAEWTYSRQVSWELEKLNKASVIMFWIPRTKELPGFTTNIEAGEFLTSPKSVFGSPQGAEKMDYLRERWDRLHKPWSDNIKSLCENALSVIGIKQPKIWFTADTHFGSQRTLDLSRRPFHSLDSMDHEIAYKWCEKVGKEDTVYHLGDFGSIKYLSGLTFERMLLLPGNYDDQATIDALKADERVFIIPSKYIYLDDMCLVHEPTGAPQDIAFYLFGHIHKLQMVKRNGLNVGVDCHNFYPIDLETVNFYRTAIEKHYDQNVFLERLGV